MIKFIGFQFRCFASIITQKFTRWPFKYADLIDDHIYVKESLTSLFFLKRQHFFCLRTSIAEVKMDQHLKIEYMQQKQQQQQSRCILFCTIGSCHVYNSITYCMQEIAKTYSIELINENYY